ncbi:MAG: hypothetical protein IJK35_07785 [Oscillospiraceae bacterium]|nr:hypothetical protein [Oscillospiraceae bacterium]
MPEERMHPLVWQTILRYLSYGWGTAIIQDLIRFRFGVKISLRCLNTIRRGGTCTGHCLETCPWKNYFM